MDVEYFTARVVYANDKFQVVYGLHEDLIHQPCMDDNPGVAMGVYSTAQLKNGRAQFEVMSRSEVESIKKRSKSRNKEGQIVGPWMSDEMEMWRKTAVRRIVKFMELSEVMEKAVEIDDAQYEMARGPEKATVDLAGLLNAPQERGAVIDLGQIRPAEPVPAELSPNAIPTDDLPWFDPVEPEPVPTEQEPQSRRRKAAPLATLLIPTIQERAKSILADLEWQCKGAGVTTERVEAYIGLPVQQWTENILEALETALQRLAKGETPQQVFPEMFAVGGTHGPK